MATPFPTDLVAAPAGGRIAWVSSNSAELGPRCKATADFFNRRWRDKKPAAETPRR